MLSDIIYLTSSIWGNHFFAVYIFSYLFFVIVPFFERETPEINSLGFVQRQQHNERTLSHSGHVLSEDCTLNSARCQDFLDKNLPLTGGKNLDVGESFFRIHNDIKHTSKLINTNCCRNTRCLAMVTLVSRSWVENLSWVTV